VKGAGVGLGVVGKVGENVSPGLVGRCVGETVGSNVSPSFVGLSVNGAGVGLGGEIVGENVSPGLVGRCVIGAMVGGMLIGGSVGGSVGSDVSPDTSSLIKPLASILVRNSMNLKSATTPKYRTSISDVDGGPNSVPQVGHEHSAPSTN